MNPSNDSRWETLLEPTTSGASTSRTVELDITDAGWAEIAILFGTEATSQPDLSLLESDTSGSGFATIVADLATQDISTSGGTLFLYQIDLRGRKKYLKLDVTIDHASVESSAVVRLSRLAEGPSGTADMVGASTDTATVV